jgi:hypothetical protein
MLAEDETDVREAIRGGAHRCLAAGDVTAPTLRVAVTEAIERRAVRSGSALASAETVRRLAGRSSCATRRPAPTSSA